MSLYEKKKNNGVEVEELDVFFVVVAVPSLILLDIC